MPWWRRFFLTRYRIVTCHSYAYLKRSWCHSELLGHCNWDNRSTECSHSRRMEWLTPIRRWLQARQHLRRFRRLFPDLEHSRIRSSRSLQSSCDRNWKLWISLKRQSVLHLSWIWSLKTQSYSLIKCASSGFFYEWLPPMLTKAVWQAFLFSSESEICKLNKNDQEHSIPWLWIFICVFFQKVFIYLRAQIPKLFALCIFFAVEQLIKRYAGETSSTN